MPSNVIEMAWERAAQKMPMPTSTTRQEMRDRNGVRPRQSRYTENKRDIKPCHAEFILGKITGSDKGLSPGWHQAIIWTNAGILLNGPLGTNFGEIFIEIYIFLLKKMHLKMLSGNWQPFCLSLNVLTHCGREDLRKWTIFNTILTSPKSWLSQEDLDAGFEHSLMPMDS